MVYKIAQHLNKFACLLLIFFMQANIAFSQDMRRTSTGLTIVNNVKALRETTQSDSLKRMVDLQELIPDLSLDLRYASTNNFMHRIMYPEQPTHTFMRKVAADGLYAIQMELDKRGLGLKIFDAYRPYAVTVKFWELVHDERYVADPSKGSGHNRGIAVDLTIIDLASAKELKMPTGFDNFTDTAHQDFMQLPAEVLQNRLLLRSTMEKHGFIAFPTEWWHYYLPNSDRYEVLDLGFNDLTLLANQK